MNVEDALRGLAAVVETTGLTCYETIPAKLTPPCAVCELGESSYDTLGNDLHAILTLRLISNLNEPDAAQRSLWDYLIPTGAKSIRKAIDDDPTLPYQSAATVDSALFVGWEPFETVDVAGVVYLSLPGKVDVLA